METNNKVSRRCKHGHDRKGNSSPTYKTWLSMKARCDNPKSDNYKHYGAKGITICHRWRKFENFLADMGERPHGKTLDRIRPEGNYEPSNCRWATSKQQASNKQGTLFVDFYGFIVPLRELGLAYNISTTTIYRRFARGLRNALLVSSKNLNCTRVGSSANNTKLTEKEVIDIKIRLQRGETSTAIALVYGVRQPTISDIKRGRTWSHIKLTGDNE